MEDKLDVVKEFEIKNQELFNDNKLIILENVIESVLLFYSKNVGDSDKKDNPYCDNVAQEVIDKINSLLDNKDDVTQKEKVSALVNAFFDMFKNEVNTIFSQRLDIIKTNIQSIDESNYENKLNEELLTIVQQISNFYQENINMLIDEIEDGITEYQTEFKDYLLNNVHAKLINILKDKLMISAILINNKYDENVAIFQRINEKTLK